MDNDNHGKYFEELMNDFHLLTRKNFWKTVAVFHDK